MNDLTIPARLVAEGAGTPDSWRDASGWLFDSREEIDQLHEYELDLSDPQTAFGCALKLDEWERARNRYWDFDDHLWERRWRDPEAMIARLRVIGEDAMIRRALGWEVEAGTLARLEQHGGRDWSFVFPSEKPDLPKNWEIRVFTPCEAAGMKLRIATWVPALDGITDPDGARTAIWREVSDVG